jgi:peptide/nickel transport system substrate-binding protein
MSSYSPVDSTPSEVPKRRRSLVDRFFASLYALPASDGFLMRAALCVFGLFLLIFLAQASAERTVSVPATGGTFTEGIVGVPRFVNPVLAVTRADRDLAALIYDGLLRVSAQGSLEPNLAESITVSEDGLTYNVVLKSGIVFHDGRPLTAHDVAFTIERIQDPLLSSPMRGNFDGVKVEVLGDHELNFVLPESYALFTENLTVGILPEHIWKDAGTEEFPFSPYNNEPIGSGPYKIHKIVRSVSGIPEVYILHAYEGYVWGQPRIDTFEIHFFSTEAGLIEAFQSGVVSSVVGVTPETISALGINNATHHLERIPLPRTFAVFLNPNKATALRDPAARTALSAAIDRTELIRTVLQGYGNPLSGPVPPGFGATASVPTSTQASDEDVRAILRNGGWKLNEESGVWEKKIDDAVVPLSFTIATANQSGFAATAEFLKEAWQHMGADVQIDQFEQTDLTQGVIRPRNYEALLFGTHLGRSLDYYSFWHSSQRNDPGLNVALFANITTDSILSEMRRSAHPEERIARIEHFAQELNIENPAFFLYAPELLYVFPNAIAGASFTGVGEPQDRFARVYEWFIETDAVWPLFTD